LDKETFDAFHAVIEGHVQGVGFRFSALDKARQIGRIYGYVKNLPDGTVEVRAEGNSEKVAEFLAWLKKGPPGARIAGVRLFPASFQGVFKRFSIDY
jgi:acylphosphatase